MLTNKEQDLIQQVRQKEHEKKRVLDSTVKFHPNHRCFEINVETLEIKEAEYRHAATFHTGYKKQVDKRPGFAYILAMNKSNALKKYHNQNDKN